MMLRTLINNTRPQPSVFLGKCLSLLPDVRRPAQTETERDNSLDLCKMRENIVHPLLREIWDIYNVLQG